MPTEAQRIALRQATRLNFEFITYQRETRLSRLHSSTAQSCPAGWDAGMETLDGEFDLDDPLALQLIRQLQVQQPQQLAQHSWLGEYLLGQWGGAGLGSELTGAALGPGNILGNSTTLAQAGDVFAQEIRNKARLQAGARQVAAGTAQSVRISPHMELYNANKGKGRPRVRLRVKGLPLLTLTPIRPAADWRPGARGSAHSTAWRNTSPQDLRRAGTVAATDSMSRRFGWATGKVGTGILTFAPTLALDTYNNIQFEVDAQGQRHIAGFKGRNFVADSAKNQLGNAAGLAAGIGIARGVGFAAAQGIGVALALSGWPVILLGLGVGILVQAVWSNSDTAKDLQAALQ